jgi:hypothetical protein
MKKEEPKVTPEQIKPKDPLETIDESEETPDFTKIKGRIKSEEATEFDTSTVSDAVTPITTEEEKKEETPEEPPKEAPEEPAKEPEKVEPAAPEVPAEVTPPTPTISAVDEGLTDDLIKEGNTFDKTLRNPEWRPQTWLELHEEQERFKDFQTRADDYLSKQETTKELATINKVWDEQLTVLKTKGNAYGVELPADTDRKIEKQIFAIMTEFGDEQKGTVMPLPKAAKIWKERQDRSKPQPAGANAPVSSGETEAPKVTGKKYSDIHNKSVDDLIELGLKGQES